MRLRWKLYSYDFSDNEYSYNFSDNASMDGICWPFLYSSERVVLFGFFVHHRVCADWLSGSNENFVVSVFWERRYAAFEDAATTDNAPLDFLRSDTSELVLGGGPKIALRRGESVFRHDVGWFCRILRIHYCAMGSGTWGRRSSFSTTSFSTLIPSHRKEAIDGMFFFLRLQSS